jgi:AhpD family alkylhydroperoxidase
MDPNNIQQTLLDYKQGVGRLSHHLPELVQRYNEFTETCFADGALSKKMKHLIALSLSVYTNDEYCIIYHTKGAVDQGASEQEILEAACVSGAFGGGMSMSQTVTLVQDALEEFKQLH